MERDKYTCQVCLDDSADRLDIHHIIPIHKNGLDVMNNLTTLCPKCHNLMHINFFVQYHSTGGTKFSCVRCNKSWISHKYNSHNPPVVCGKCSSPYWNRPKLLV